MKQILILTISLIFICTNACKKALSYETPGGVNSIAKGTLQDSMGNCMVIIAKGTYQTSNSLTDSNYLLVTLNITSTGKYVVSSDSGNGFWFKDSGYVLNPGLQTVKVKGYGKPLLPVVTVKTVTFDSSSCQVSINCGQLPLATNTDYFPTTIGSSWTYFTGTNLNDYFTATVSNLYTTIGNYAYSLFANSYVQYSPDTSAYRKDGNGNYYQYITLLDTSTGPIDYPFLKDYKNVGDYWESDTVAGILNAQYVTVKYGLTIISKDTTITFNGSAYSNIIAVEEQSFIKLTSAASFGQASDYDYSYYGKGLGWLGTVYPTHPADNITIKVPPIIN